MKSWPLTDKNLIFCRDLLEVLTVIERLGANFKYMPIEPVRFVHMLMGRN